MKAIHWSDDMSVHVQEIDAQHQYFIELLDELYEAILATKAESELDGIIAKLVTYAELHFRTEEEYFDRFQYEHSAEHKEKHAELFAQVVAFSEKHQDNKMDLAVQLLDFLEDWLVNHLETQDKLYVQCFREHGLV